MAPMRLMVSMIGMNRETGTRESVEALLRSTEPFHLSLTNQNSSDGTGRYFDEVQRRYPERVTVFHEKTNTFFQPPNNRAYHLAFQKGCDFFLCLNDDAIIPPNGLAKMLEVMDSNPAIGVVGAKGGCEQIGPDFNGEGGRLEFVEGSCAMYRIAAMRGHRKTLFWEELQGIYSEDSEASLFLQEKGWSIAKADFELPHARSSTVNRDPATQAACLAFQKRNHELCKRRYSHWIKTRRFDHPIILRRSYAIGDVLLITPIIRAIAQSNPLCPIHIQTNYPELFARNPHVAGATVARPDLMDALFIDLDGSYENQPMTHLVEAYERTTRQALPGLGKVELRTEIFPAKADMEWAKARIDALPDRTYAKPKLACICSEPTTWRGKNYSEQKYEQLRAKLWGLGWRTITVGNKRSELQTTFSQLTGLLSQANLFIGNDSFCLHAAQAAGCPVVAPFGPTRARFILTQGSKAAGVDASPSIPCAGERHRTVGKTFVDCDASCINSITVDQMWAAIEKLGVLS